jgi:hypothetical protein
MHELFLIASTLDNLGWQLGFRGWGGEDKNRPRPARFGETTGCRVGV